jgi:hypothetical protein
MTNQVDLNSTQTALSIDDLLARQDHDFVQCAYQSILRRPPDPVGFDASLTQLRSGVSKLTILKQMRCSPEGNQNHPLIQELDMAIQELVSETDRLMHASTSSKALYFKFKAAAAVHARKVISCVS